MKVSPGAFIAQVRQETSKVTWPTRRETLLTTVMVLVLSTIAAIFFFFIDQIIGYGVQSLLTISA